MIPKIIHFCWFGNADYPDLVKECMDTWQTYLPDYKIMLWNENNFKVDDYLFAKEALQANKYAFVADVCRLVALKDYGGIYLDTDVALLKPLDAFLLHKAFVGFEDDNSISTALIGSEKDGDWVKNMLLYYEGRSFFKPNGEKDLTTNVEIISKIMQSNGVALNNQYYNEDNYITIYPSEYFSPKSHVDGKIRLTEHTVSVHHFAGTWFSNSKKVEIELKRLVRRTIGNKTFDKLKKVLGK